MNENFEQKRENDTSRHTEQVRQLTRRYEDISVKYLLHDCQVTNVIFGDHSVELAFENGLYMRESKSFSDPTSLLITCSSSGALTNHLTISAVRNAKLKDLTPQQAQAIVSTKSTEVIDVYFSAAEMSLLVGLYACDYGELWLAVSEVTALEIKNLDQPFVTIVE